MPRFDSTRASFATLAILFLAYGVITELRSAFQNERKTDLTVYTAAAGAIRAGQDPYAIADEHGWHYCYPPPFAIAMLPFAEPMPGATGLFLPFAITVAVWYALSVASITAASHLLARSAKRNIEAGSTEWWQDRLVPIWLCLGGIGMTLGRGQVNLIVVALIALSLSATIRGRSYSAGFWLGVATCIKVIPAMLFLVPLLRRDLRMLAGGILSTVLLLGVVPLLVWGPAGAWEMNRKTLEQIVGPGIFGHERDARSEELTNAIATDNQSIQYVIHNWRYPDEATRPKDYEPISKIAHLAVAFGLLGVSSWAILRCRDGQPTRAIIASGSLAALLPIVSPVSHMHYYAFAFPLVAGLWLHNPRSRTTRLILTAWAIIIVTSFLPIPFWKGLRPFGSCTFATLGLWAFGIGTLATRSVQTPNAGDCPALDSVSASVLPVTSAVH